MSNGGFSRKLFIHGGLFLLACFTTTWAGADYSNPTTTPLHGKAWLDWLLQGLPFSCSLMAILLAHEMGHFVLARKHNVDVSLPYFIPLPFGLVGTMGAVIRLRQQITSRNQLFDVGVAGPIAGLVIAVPVLIYGIATSPVRPAGPGMLEGNSILYGLFKLAIKGQWLPGSGLDIGLNSVAWAGWVGLLVTMINLIPVGQLDGGHISQALLGERNNRLAPWIHRALLPLAILASTVTVLELSQKTSRANAIALGASSGLSWLIWWAMIRLMKRGPQAPYHPPVEADPLTPGRRILGWTMLAVFILIFMPIPLRPTL